MTTNVEFRKHPVAGIMAVLLIIAAILAVIGIIWSVIAGIIRFCAYTEAEGNYPTASDFMNAQGVNLNEEHPLELGNSIVGTEGTVKGGGNFTGFSFEGYSHPTSAIRLGWQQNGHLSYIIEVPYPKVHFNQVPNSDPTASISLDSKTASDTPYGIKCGNFYTAAKECSPDAASLKDMDEWKKGSAFIIQEHLNSITLTVTPEQYRSYLNGTGASAK